MKAIILLIALFVVSTQADYVTVPAADYNKLPLLKSTRDFGLKLTLDKLIADGKIINVTYHIIANNSIANMTNADLIFYKFNLTLSNVQEDIIKTNFIVQYNKTRKSNRLVSSKSIINYGTRNNATYVRVPVSQYNSPAVNGSIDFGVNFVTMKLKSLGKIPSGVYRRSEIFRVDKQVNATVTNYKCAVEIQNADKNFTLNSTFFVKYRPANQARSVFAYSYKIFPN